jgi:hypothetical protein
VAHTFGNWRKNLPAPVKVGPNLSSGFFNEKRIWLARFPTRYFHISDPGHLRTIKARSFIVPHILSSARSFLVLWWKVLACHT